MYKLQIQRADCCGGDIAAMCVRWGNEILTTVGVAAGRQVGGDKVRYCVYLDRKLKPSIEPPSYLPFCKYSTLKIACLLQTVGCHVEFEILKICNINNPNFRCHHVVIAECRKLKFKTPWWFKLNTLPSLWLSNVDQPLHVSSRWSHFLTLLQCNVFQIEVRLPHSHSHPKWFMPPKNLYHRQNKLFISSF
jgi:hypothetical protein